MMIAHPPVPPHYNEQSSSSWGIHDVDMSMEEEELQDICEHVQRHSNHIVVPPPEAPKPVIVEVQQAPPPPATSEDYSPETPDVSSQADEEPETDSLAEDQARLCAIKREAINLLSAAHKSTSGAGRIQAMTLLAALYKAETKQDLAALGGKVQELLLEKKQQDEELERIRAEEEANRAPERFSRIRASMSRMVQHQSDNRSVTSLPTPRQGKGWRFFWQRDGDAAQSRRSSHESGIHGLGVPSSGAAVHANRNARLQSLSERRKIWDTRTI